MKKLLCVLLVLALLCCCSCSEVKTPEGLVEGSVVITTENLPKICVDKNYEYIGKSLVATLLRTDDDAVISENISSCDSSSELYDKLLNNECDIVIGVAPDEETENALKNGGVTLKSITISHDDALVFFCNPNTGVDNLTEEQIASIFSGKVKNWSELGGTNQPISAFFSPKDSLENVWFEEYLKLETKAEVMTDKLSGDLGVYLAPVSYDNRPGAIGYTRFTTYYDNGVGGKRKKLLINGVEPYNETLENGSYPYTKKIVIAIKSGLEKDNVTEIIYNWLISEQGKEYLKTIK